MYIIVTDTTLKRLVNYEAVVKKRYQEAEKRQWMEMTLDVMQGHEKAKARAQQVSAVTAYARYLNRLRKGFETARVIYAEPQLNRSLVDLMQELRIPIRSVTGGNLSSIAGAD